MSIQNVSWSLEIASRSAIWWLLIPKILAFLPFLGTQVNYMSKPPLHSLYGHILSYSQWNMSGSDVR